MAKIKFDSILRCANVNCVHNRDGYNCTCSVITLNADGQCALNQPKPVKTKPNPNPNPFDYSNAC